MATKRNWHCRSGCTPIKAASLFDALLSIAKGEKPDCTRHPGNLRDLKLEFPLGLGATDSLCTVARAFLPRELERWTDPRNGSAVCFYPFLVVLKRQDREHAAWLPYWHIVKYKNGKVKNKYGQWAPFMDEHLLHDLLKQAHDHGFLVSSKGKLSDLVFRPTVVSGQLRASKISKLAPKADGKQVFEGTIGKKKYLLDAGNGDIMLELKTGDSHKNQAATIKRALVPRNKASRYAVNLLFKRWRQARDV